MSRAALVLIVDDSQDQLDLLRVLLARAGYEVFAAIDAESAIAAFDDITPEIAILDLILPGVSGQECATKVRERFPECAIIVSSVLDAIDYPEADAALPKPVTGAMLYEAIEKVAA